MSIRVMLADDQTLTRKGIRSLLELSAGIAVVCEAGDGDEVLSGLVCHQPDVLLLDIRMPKMTGIEVLHAMSSRGLMVPTIILTTFDDEELVLQGLDAGARGYLLKDVSLDVLVNAIKQVQSGGRYVQPVVTERVLKGLAELKLEFDYSTEPESLTPREVEVLRLMAGGYSNREISLAIYRSEGTVKNLVSSILSKLGTRDRTRAVLRAIDIGLLGK